MNYILKAHLNFNYYFTESLEVLLTNTLTYAISIYDDNNNLITKNDAQRVEEQLMTGAYTYTLYGTNQGHVFQITLYQDGHSLFFITLLPMTPIKTFSDNSDELDVAWYATVLINLCQGLTLERMYVGTEELCSQDMKEFFRLVPFEPEI